MDLVNSPVPDVETCSFQDTGKMGMSENMSSMKNEYAMNACMMVRKLDQASGGRLFLEEWRMKSRRLKHADAAGPGHQGTVSMPEYNAYTCNTQNMDAFLSVKFTRYPTVITGDSIRTRDGVTRHARAFCIKAT